MDLGYRDKVVLVTGAASTTGFGRQICLSVAEEGAKIVACGTERSQADLEETIRLVKEKEVEALALIFDVRDRDAVNDAVAQAIETFGGIDVLINNAGASKLQHTPFMEMSRDVWEFDIEVNLFGQMNMLQSVVPHMIKAGGGRIINTAGGRGISGLSTYGAAKAGVVEWTKAVAIELAPYNIQVNCFSPGLSHTGLVKGSDDNLISSIARATPQKRLNTPVDVANVVTFLASEKNSYMTGKLIENQ